MVGEGAPRFSLGGTSAPVLGFDVAEAHDLDEVAVFLRHLVDSPVLAAEHRASVGLRRSTRALRR
jgi:hypothetical protein